MHLSLSAESLFIPVTACKDQASQCPLPLPNMWEKTGAQATFASNNSATIDASSWHTTISRPLGLEGTGYYMQDRILLENAGNLGFLDSVANTVADNFTVVYPGGPQYTLDVGFLSLNGAANYSNWKSANGTDVKAIRALPAAYVNGHIPSISYGLHIGSVSPNISGCLIRRICTHREERQHRITRE